ncbi:ATP-binding protein [Sessilibacter corallicola]|uniref:ATP-binding protein n=1 Tax=Sessilibacter corallicola TaxID=2904075 RepID=UPI001E64ECED|nr:ATP-binding protein [Sessilibacter corallicola]MCE2030145.1 ATP-binding protein [Sessilibacter corallicola]
MSDLFEHNNMIDEDPQSVGGNLLTDENAWLSVIQKMDEAYSDLVDYQVQMEEQNAKLEEAQNFFDSVQSAMSDVLIACDHEGKIQQVNRACEELTGCQSESLIGQFLVNLCPQESRDILLDCLRRVRRSPVRDQAITLNGINGAVPLALNCSPRFNPRGRLVGIVIAGRPLGELQKAFNELNAAHAELKLAQERLVQSEKMASLGRLVAGVAHELNNPISFVYGNMHALRRYTTRLVEYFNAVQSGASREQLQQLRNEMRLNKAIADLDSLVEGTLEGADRVREIVNDLKQFSSTQRSEKLPFDLVHVAQSALHWILKESPEVDVKKELPEHLCGEGHSGQIHQVVVNLIQNAVDAIKGQPNPILSIRAGKKDVDGKETLWLEIEDNGPGIADADLPHLFDPFFTTKPPGKGTGLGLSISYGIVAEHGGELSIKNRPLGGATALLLLPKCPSNEDG